MKNNRLFTRIITLVLVLGMLICDQAWGAVAKAVEQDKELDTQYVSEVKVFYASSADEGRAYCEDEGFIFCPERLNFCWSEPERLNFFPLSERLNFCRVVSMASSERFRSFSFA